MRVAILAGGRSSRMGEDKALLRVGGVTMLERVARAGAAAGYSLVILGREGAPEGWPDSLPAEFLPDRGGARGPMPALIGVLERYGGAVLLLACDMPLITAGTLEALVAAHAAGGKAATVAVSTDAEGEYVEPTLAVYTAGVLGVLRGLSGSFQPLLHSPEVHQWPVPVERRGELMNVNDRNGFEAVKRLKSWGI